MFVAFLVLQMHAPVLMFMRFGPRGDHRGRSAFCERSLVVEEAVVLLSWGVSIVALSCTDVLLNYGVLWISI